MIKKVPLDGRFLVTMMEEVEAEVERYKKSPPLEQVIKEGGSPRAMAEAVVGAKARIIEARKAGDHETAERELADLLGPLFHDLHQAGTRRLEAKAKRPRARQARAKDAANNAAKPLSKG